MRRCRSPTRRSTAPSTSRRGDAEARADPAPAKGPLEAICPLAVVKAPGPGQDHSDGDDLRAPARGRRPSGPRPLGGRPLIGTQNNAIATLVERSTRYCQLVALPEGATAERVCEALKASITTLPAQLRRSLTWDQGSEMSEHRRFSVETGVDVYFCDPQSPWQRGSNENTNGLLRQYFPKGRASRGSARSASTRSPRSSTAGRERRSAFGPRPRSSPS